LASHHRRLEQLGQWLPLYQSMAFVAITQAAMYLAACRVHGPNAEVTKECHQIARLLLCDMLYLDSVVEVPRDDLGRDTDLISVCEPLRDL
jgi:hypothetical protein